MTSKYERTGANIYVYKDKSKITHITSSKPPKGVEIIPNSHSGGKFTARYRQNNR